MSRLTQAHTSVSAVRGLVQRSEHKRRLAEIMGDPRFEPEAAGVGQADVNALSVPHLVGTKIVRTENGDVKVEK